MDLEKRIKELEGSVPGHVIVVREYAGESLEVVYAKQGLEPSPGDTVIRVRREDCPGDSGGVTSF